MRRYFIIGTDTDCGKTYVTCQLLDYLKANGKTALGVKPVASGCVDVAGQLVSDDEVQLRFHNGNIDQSICHWRFQPPISPDLAAEEVGEVLSAQAIMDYCSTKTSNTDYMLIEGAGGLMSPLNGHETWLDCLSLSNTPVILVVGMRLGCLNHALLTEFALKSQNIACIGWIANCIDDKMLALSANINSLSEKISWPLLATIPYGGNLLDNTTLIRVFMK